MFLCDTLSNAPEQLLFVNTFKKKKKKNVYSFFHPLYSRSHLKTKKQHAFMDLFLLLCQSTRTFNIFIQNIFPVSSYSSICRER